MRRIIFFLSGLFLSLSVLAATSPNVQEMAKKEGFFFFYSAACPHCQQFAPTLKKLSVAYGFHVVAISVDGGFLPDFPKAVMNEGQTKTFNVSVYPTLFLVNPETQTASLVSEGNISFEELEARLMKLYRIETGQEGAE